MVIGILDRWFRKLLEIYSWGGGGFVYREEEFGGMV